MLGAAAFAGWWFRFRDDAPPGADIDSAGETLNEAAGSGTDGTAADGSAAGGFEGTWTVDQSIGSFEDDFSGTWAGHRFQEELAGIGPARQSAAPPT